MKVSDGPGLWVLNDKRPIRLMELNWISRYVCDSVSIYYWICNLFQDVELDLVALVGEWRRRNMLRKPEYAFSNCANVERKNGSQFLGFIYKRWYNKLNDNRTNLTPVVSTIQFEPRCIHECLVYFHIKSLVTKEVPRVRVPFFHIEKIPYCI